MTLFAQPHDQCVDRLGNDRYKDLRFGVVKTLTEQVYRRSDSGYVRGERFHLAPIQVMSRELVPPWSALILISLYAIGPISYSFQILPY